ncbi:hypothetical protein B484DRAFT_478481 [Ochromonadaceae sp. CCMP2298]|nr:hypothetical protein B484DRAFT_478481 [Ochromonadaceae sp. CCMP2298]
MGFETSALAVLLVGIVAKMSSLAASNATWVTTPEYYSTQIRTVGHASCVAWSKVGALCAPFMITSSLSNVAVGTILRLVNLVGAVAAQMLRETGGLELDKIDVKSRSSSYDGVGADYVLNELRMQEGEFGQSTIDSDL